MADGKALPRGWTIGLLALAVVARLVFAVGYWQDKPLTRDEREYLSLARGLTTGAGFVYDDEVYAGGIDPFGRAPAYPAWLAMLGAGRAMETDTPLAVKVAQSLIGGVGVWLIGLLAARLAGQRAGLAAMAIAAVYPPLVWLPAFVFSEALFWPLGLASVWLFDRAHQASTAAARTRWALAAGLCAGVASLVRSVTIIFLVFAGCWWLWQRRWVPLTALTIGACLVVLPWTARNVGVHGRLVLIATDGGVTFWTGNHPLATGEGDMAANPDIRLAHLALRAQHPDRTEQSMEPIYWAEALRWIRESPGAWLTLQVKKAYYLVVPTGPSYTLHSATYYWSTVLSYVPVLLLAVGAAATRRIRWRATPGLWLLTLAAIAIALAFFPQERFRIPVIDPALIVVAATWWRERDAA